MSDLLTAFRAHLAGDHRAPRTIDTYTKIATAFLATTTGPAPDRKAIDAFLARPRQDGSQRAATGRNQELAALRSFARVAVDEKAWEANPTKGVRFVREAPRDPAVLDENEVRHVFRTAAEKPPAGEGPQILAILGLLSQTGLRVHELVGLNLPQVDLASGTLLGVHGKGNTVHDLPLNAPAIALLSDWLKARTDRAPPEEQALFVSSRRTRLAARTIENWFVHLRAAMGTKKKVTPHTLRHSFATNQLIEGTDLATVAENMRHTDLNSTRRYLHLVDTRRREAVRRLAVTVPQEVLPAPESASEPTPPTPIPPKAILPVPAEFPAIPREKRLDDQYGMAAA